jgi:hypothetical protein
MMYRDRVYRARPPNCDQLNLLRGGVEQTFFIIA